MNTDIKKRIDAINNTEAIQYFFNLLKELIEDASLSETDERLAINVRNDYRKRFSVNINGRLILSIKDGNEFGLMINNSDLEKIKNIPVLRTEIFEKQIPEASLLFFDFDILRQNEEILKSLWLQSCLEYLPVQTASQYRRHHIDELYKIAIDEETLNEYLAPVSDKANSFTEMINEFRIYLKNEDNILSDFKIFPVTSNSRWVWISDSQNILNDTIAHYEIILRRGIIHVEIHFEGKKTQKDKFNKNISGLPEKAKWFDWNNSQSIRYDETYRLNDDDLLQKLANALLYLEENLGNQLRKIKNAMNQINVKEEFLRWLIATDGVDNNYFTQQFGANIDRFKAELNEYEEVYKKDFGAELFVIDFNNLKQQIEAIKTNIYGNSIEFAKYSKDKSNDRPRAILGKKNYLKFLSEYFANKDNLGGSVTNNDYEKMTLNQILYGPPGTGKTYNTINKSLEIIGIDTIDHTREDIKDIFDGRVAAKQIVFSTFHQSMSYEDFIEGIKPQTKNEKVTYSVEDGVFKALVKKALIEYIRKDADVNETNGFDTLYNDFVKSIKPLEGNRQGTFTTKTGVEIMLVEANNTSIQVKYLWSNNKKEAEGQHTFSVTKEKLKKVLLEGIEPAKIKSLKAELHPLIGHIHCELFAVYKSFYDFAINNKGEIETIHFDYEELSFEEVKEQFDLLSKEEINNKNVKPYIIIIDEINRGNVSQIFGELITLIEEDKRLGKEEALEVILTYSKEKFGVPPNVFIIGTMNTADRSVEALDTALRRRFTFEEMPSIPNLIGTKGKLKESNGEVEGINLPKVLETINNRIEILSNRDHKIGHAYFMKVTTVQELRETFKKNIIPLLQEYFYNDYEKIGWVIGEGFFEEKKTDKKAIFTKFFNEPKPEFEVNYQLADIDKIDIKQAITKLLGKAKDDNQSEDSED